jgi:hypothetical protein
MAKRYKAHGQPTKLVNYVKLDDLPEYLRQKYDAYRLTEQTLQVCLDVASGEDAITSVSKAYSLQDNPAEARRRAREILTNPKIVETINIIRQNFKQQTIIDTNSILVRLEMLYGDCILDGDRANALKILKQMSDIVTKVDGAISVGEVNIQFTLPNVNNVKKIDIEDAEISE